MPATLDDVAKIARSLPDVVPGGGRHGDNSWAVPDKKGKLKVFVWERGYSKADLRRFGDVTPPQGPNVAVWTESKHMKEAILAEGVKGVFTIEHFDNYPLVLIHLKTVSKKTLREMIVDSYEAKRG